MELTDEPLINRFSNKITIYKRCFLWGWGGFYRGGGEEMCGIFIKSKSIKIQNILKFFSPPVVV